MPITRSVRGAIAVLVLAGYGVVHPLAAAENGSSATHDPLPGLVLAPRTLPGVGRWQLAQKIPRGRIFGLAWSRDGKQIAFTDASYIRICDAQTFSVQHVLAGHTHRVNGIDWNHATNRIASAGFDGIVTIWSAEGAPQHVLKGHTGAVTSVAWTKDGTRLASVGHDGSLRIWSSDGSLVRHIEGAVPINCVAWSPDGTRVLTGDEKNHINIWKVDGTREHVCEGHLARVTNVAWSPDGSRFASIAGSYKPPEENSAEFADLRLWNADGSQAGSIVRNMPFIGLSWTADSKSLATNSGNELLFLGSRLEIQKKWQVQGLTWRMGVTSMVGSPDGEEFAFAGVTGITVVVKGESSKQRTSPTVRGAERRNVMIHAMDPQRGRLLIGGVGDEHTSDRFWDLAAGTEIEPPRELLAGKIVRLAFCDQAFDRDGNRIVFATDNRLSTWKAGSGKPQLVSTADRPIVTAVWSPTDDRIAYCDEEGTFRVINEKGMPIAQWSAKQAPQNIPGVGLSVVNMKWTNDGRAILFKEGSRLGIRRLDGAESTSIDFAAPFEEFWIAPDFRRAVAAYRVGLEKVVVRIWRADKSQVTEVSGLPTDLDAHDVSADASHLIVGRDSGDVELRPLDEDGASPLEIAAHADSCMASAFSPDGQRVATGGWDSLIKIWRMDGTLERTLEGNAFPIYALWWSRDGKRMLSTARDATVCLWSVADARVETRVIRTATGENLQILRDGRVVPDSPRIIATELVVLLEKPDGSTEIVEYPDFLKRTGQPVQ